MIFKLNILTVFFSAIFTLNVFGGDAKIFVERSKGLEKSFLLAQASDAQSPAIDSGIGLSELTRLESQVREIAAKQEDLDSRLKNLRSKLDSFFQQQSNGFEQLSEKMGAIENRLNLSATENDEIYRDLKNNLAQRISLIEDALLQKPQDDNTPIIEGIIKRISVLEELAIKLTEESQALAMEHLEERLKFIEDSLLTKLDEMSRPYDSEVEEKNNQVRESAGDGKQGGQGDAAVDEYNAAIFRYEKRNFLGAIEIFDGFIKKYPSHKLVSNAHYWIGNSYFALKEYDLAIKKETIILTSYPDSKKMPDALLVIGSSHKQLGNTEDARESWTTLIRRYPNSDSAIKAAERLEDLP